MTKDPIDTTLLNAKRLDVYGQVAALLIPIAFSIATDSSLIWVMFAVGSWQVLSFLIHLFDGDRPWKQRSRKNYGWTLAALAVLGLITYASPNAIILFLVAAFFGGIVLGIWYFMISFNEYITVRGV